MKLYVLVLILMFAKLNGFAHSGIQGKMIDASTNSPLLNIYVQILNLQNKSTLSDQDGYFDFKGLSSGVFYLQFSSIGYKTRIDTIVLTENENKSLTVYLKEDILELPSVVITARKDLSQSIINSIDFKLRTHTTTQDLLRLVPGLFIAQHAGGGKAEQIFLRGFDVDHGTDVAVAVDDMPVNMVSHAHGQGYADLHFVIPETVNSMSFAKGCYDGKIGDLNTAGAVNFQTKNSLSNSLVKYEVGKFGMHRGLALINILPRKDSLPSKHNAYIASEYFHTQGYFNIPQKFHRVNIFGKYNGEISKHSVLTLSLSTFSSRWNAFGQIPQRAVDNGSISWFGSIDPTEGGNTGRSNVNLLLTTYMHNSGVIRNQIYMIDYSYNLYSNFTFFKDDSINGDQIRQYEHRHTIGYNGSYSNTIELGKYTLKTTSGIGYRGDRISNIGLAHTVKRNFLEDVKKGSIWENNINAYTDATLVISDRLTANAGLRYDILVFEYKSKLNDSMPSYAANGILSPKFSLYYKLASDVQIYANTGYGFHSNDARVAVYRSDITSLPRAKSIDLGTNARLFKRIFLNAALWYMYMQSEYVYVGDDGLLELSGSTKRLGFDFSARCQLLQWLYVNYDINLSKPRYVNLPYGENHVPLAPGITSVGGIGVNSNNGFSGSVGYRYLGKRPATEDNSVIASGYFILDAVVNYQRKHYLFSLSAENLLNNKWKEAQFATESKLRGETAPITEIHFTPGTPLFVKGSVAVSF